MLPIFSRCYVRHEGIGLVEAVCNNKPRGGVDFSYAVRLDKKPTDIKWFPWDEVEQYNGPNSEENKNQTKKYAEDEDEDES